jgi:hypothetical protein
MIWTSSFPIPRIGLKLLVGEDVTWFFDEGQESRRTTAVFATNGWLHGKRLSRNASKTPSRDGGESSEIMSR